MYYDNCTYRRGSRVYRRELLRESRRVDGKVVKHTVANISHWPESVKQAIIAALAQGKGKDAPEGLAALLASGQGAECRQGKSAGAVAAVLAVAEHLGIRAALGDSRQGKLAMFQVLARVCEQGSRLSAVRNARQHIGAELLGLDNFTEDDLYENLNWLHDHQAQIEDKLYAKRYAASARPGLFLYDVTSSYFEGEHNDLAAFGYNRDGKKGKKQVIAGLLTGPDGCPLAIELFPGNTSDPQTVDSQLHKLRERFGGGELTLVGDRGMLKSPQQKALASSSMHYLTAISKPQIEKLLKDGLIQMELFDEELAEVTTPGASTRYILRRNPDQASRIAHRRADQFATWQKLLEARQTYLTDHPRAKVETAIKHLQNKAKTYKLTWLHIEAKGRKLQYRIDENAREQACRLDGCYVLQTDLHPSTADAATLDQRYHDLAQVEWGFRTCKTAHLELRPIYLRRAHRTKAHALVVMLAYHIIRELREKWVALDQTVEEGLRELRQLCTLTITLPDGKTITEIPKPRPTTATLLEAANIQLPRIIPPPTTDVDTKSKLQKRRKPR